MLMESFQPKKVTAMNTEHRDFKRDFPQDGRSGNYGYNGHSSDNNEASIKTMHENVMICNVHNKDVTKFALAFDNMRTSNVFSTFDI